MYRNFRKTQEEGERILDVIGVVGEFNPFHLGHYTHLCESRRAVGRDAAVVCVMSGDFVQRGSPAVFDKHVRAEMAAKSGVDLVLELPVPWCVSSAERFAVGAVGLLDRIGVVRWLSFGSECGDLAPLSALAEAAADPAVLALVRARMGGGMSFPAAREQVLRETLGESAALLRSPNNVLGVEYLKALRALGSAIRPMTTRRAETVHDAPSSGGLRGASELRAMLAAGQDVRPYVPLQTWEMHTRLLRSGRGPVTMESLEDAVLSRLRMLPPEAFDNLPDATEGLGNRLYRAVRAEGSVAAILSAVKTKRYPLARLRRMVLCAALGVRADTGGAVPPYARVLASTERGRALLRHMSGGVPVVTKPASAHTLPPQARAIFELTANARELYVLGYRGEADRRGGSDWRTTPAIL